MELYNVLTELYDVLMELYDVLGCRDTILVECMTLWGKSAVNASMMLHSE